MVSSITALAGVMHLSVMAGWAAPPDVVKHTVDSARTLVKRSVVFGGMTSLAVINVNDADKVVSF